MCWGRVSGFLENILENQETIPGVGGGQEQTSGVQNSHKGTLEEQEAATTVNPPGMRHTGQSNHQDVQKDSLGFGGRAGRIRDSTRGLGEQP